MSRAAFGFVPDTGHSNIAGDLEEIAAAVGDRLVSLHLNDNRGHEDSHSPPGEGTSDWPRIVAMLQEARYSGCLLYEVSAGRRSPAEALSATLAGHRRWMVRGPE